MWYECIPPLIIIGVCTTIPAMISPILTLYFTGNKNARGYENRVQRMALLKDYEQGNGNFWKFNGLDAIPDK